MYVCGMWCVECGVWCGVMRMCVRVCKCASIVLHALMLQELSPSPKSETSSELGPVVQISTRPAPVTPVEIAIRILILTSLLTNTTQKRELYFPFFFSFFFGMCVCVCGFFWGGDFLTQ